MSLEILTSIDLNENSISGIPDNVQTVGGKKMHALDSALSETSANPVQNRAIKMKFDLIDGEINDVNDRIDNLDLDVSVDNVTIKKGDNDTLFGTGAGYYSNDTLKGEVFNLVDSQTSNVASGSYSHAEGSSTTASGDNSHAEGSNTIASGNHAHAEGYYTTAYGSASHSEGSHAQATGNYSHAEGVSVLAYGEGSHAEGHGVQNRGAIGNYSHIEGYDNYVIGEAGHAEGRDNQITGSAPNYSHAEGNANTIVAATESHIEGYKNKINSPGSAYHVEGYMNTYTVGSASSSGIYGTGAHVSGIYNTLRDGFGGTNMCGTLNTTGAVWAKSSFVAGIANRINNVSCAIGCGLMAQDHCVVVGNRNYAPSTGGINTNAVLEYTGSTDLNSLYDANCAVIMKSSGTVSELIICIADADRNLTKSNILGVNVNGTIVDPQYYSLTDDISNRSGFTNTPFDLSKIHSYYLIINAQGFTTDPNDKYTIKVSESHVLGDRYIFSVGNGMFAKDEDCHDNHRANALAVTYDGNVEVQDDLTFKYVDSSNVKHRISLQKVVDALLALNVSITDLEA